MADCNIRNIDAGLMKNLKIEAARAGITLRAFIIKTLEDATCATWITPERLEMLKDAMPFKPPKEK